jgi:O-antigen ligase
MFQEVRKIDRATVFRILLIVLMIVAAQQAPWPGGPNLQATVPFFAGAVLLFGILTKQLSWTQLRLPKPLAYILILALLSSLVSPVPWIAIPAYVEKVLWIFGTVFLISVFLPRKTRTLAVIAVTSLALQQVLWSFWQFFLAKTEAVGTLGSPNALARFVVLSWPFIGVSIPIQRRVWTKSVLCGMVVALAGVLVLSFSRLALVAFVAQAGYLMGRKKPRLTLVVVAAVAALLLISGFWGQVLRHDDLQRIDAWRMAVGLSLEHPLLGTGLGTFALYFRLAPPAEAPQLLKTPHSLWLHLACELGLLSLPLFIWLTITGWKQLLCMESKSDNILDRAFLVAARTAILGLLVLSLAEY